MYLGNDPLRDIRLRLKAADWESMGIHLAESGFGLLPRILSPEECGAVGALYGEEALFRNVVDMARYRSGRGEYKYFAYPLPPLIEALRSYLYPHLAAVSRGWASTLHTHQEYPAEHSEFLACCRAAGQTRSSPLLFRYGAGDFSRLHQDDQCDVYLPLQVMFLLSEPGQDFTGGEFLLSESIPHAQPVVRVVPARRGDAVVFASRYRPAKSLRGFSRASIKHGVSTVTSGRRLAMAILFHDVI